jgi:hypothetical protein
MALSIRNLSVLAYANGFTLWHYKSGTDTLPTVLGTGYFSNASDMLNTGDLILTVAKGGATVLVVADAEERGLVTVATLT